MVEIMETLHVHGFVPMRQCSGEASTVEQTELLNILLGGDQLTAARARGAKRVMMNGLTKQKRLKGTYPVVEDWHAKMNLLDASSYYIYSYNYTAISDMYMDVCCDILLLFP